MKPKILVGCPTSDYKSYCLNEYAQTVKSLTYDNYDILLVDNSKDENYFKRIKEEGLPVIKGKYFECARDRIVASRNMLREVFLKKGYEYLLSLEQDVIPPKDIIERMLKDNKKYVSGVVFAVNFYKGKHQLMPLLWENFDEKTKLMYYVSPDKVWGNKLIEVCASGLGCVLIHKDVLKKVKFRYEKEKEGFDDVFFGIDMIKNKIKMFADTSIKCKHLIKNWSWENIKR